MTYAESSKLEVVVTDRHNITVGGVHYNLPLIKIWVDQQPFGYHGHEAARAYGNLYGAVDAVASGIKAVEDRRFSDLRVTCGESIAMQCETLHRLGYPRLTPNLDPLGSA